MTTKASSAMKRPLHLLMLEDSDDDAELLLLEIGRVFDVSLVRVESSEALREALATHDFDLAITDYSMPSFTGVDGIRIIREEGRDLPVIMASGTLNEESAVGALQAGAEDFVVKGRLARLLPAIERALREARNRAERTAARLEAQAAVRKRMHAESMSQAKSDFLVSMSHELRTPLNVIIGFSELLEQGDGGTLSVKQGEHVDNILTSARHLLAVISDILDVSKVEAGRMSLSLEPTSIQKIAEQLRSSLMPILMQRELELELEIPAELPLIQADPLRLRQILYNLLSNALKFTEPSGTIRLQASTTADSMRLAVTDTGVGIRAENLARLFQEFEQIEPSERSKAEGSGLGLVLTRRLVELHGGTVSVQSEWGSGSTFTVTLPLRSVAERVAARPAAPAPVAEPTRSLRILVVEDDAASRKLFHVLLTRRGHDVVLATTVEEGRELLRERPLDLVVSDLHVAGGGGIQIMRDLRTSGQNARVPIVVVTAHAMNSAREELLNEGFDGYLSKPIDTRLFASTVEAFVSTSKDSPPDSTE